MEVSGSPQGVSLWKRMSRKVWEGLGFAEFWKVSSIMPNGVSWNRTRYCLKEGGVGGGDNLDCYHPLYDITSVTSPSCLAELSVPFCGAHGHSLALQWLLPMWRCGEAGHPLEYGSCSLNPHRTAIPGWASQNSNLSWIHLPGFRAKTKFAGRSEQTEWSPISQSSPEGIPFVPKRELLGLLSHQPQGWEG